MKSFLEFLRVAVISLEFAFTLAVLGISYGNPDFVAFVGDSIRSQSEVIKWIPAIPVTLCALAFQWAWKLTTPLEKNSRELMDWPGYWRLKLRRNYSLVLSVWASALAIIIWVFAQSLSTFWLGALSLICLGVATINSGCMFMASLTLREILEG
jgi:hypothetical protein